VRAKQVQQLFALVTQRYRFITCYPV